MLQSTYGVFSRFGRTKELRVNSQPFDQVGNAIIDSGLHLLDKTRTVRVGVFVHA